MSARLTIPQDLPVLTEEAPKPRGGVHLPASQKSARSRAGSAGRSVLTGVLLAVGVITGVGLMEYANPSETYRPSYLLGTLGGRKAAAELNAERDAQAAYVNAVKDGELKAQAVFEAQLATIKADAQNTINAFAAELERSNKAYEALYQMTNSATQIALEMEKSLALTRAETVASGQTGKRQIAALADWVGVLGELAGDPSIAIAGSAYGDRLRSEMASEVSRGAMMDVGSMHRSIMARVPNVAEIRLQQEANIRAAIEQARNAQAAAPAAPVAPGP